MLKKQELTTGHSSTAYQVSGDLYISQEHISNNHLVPMQIKKRIQPFIGRKNKLEKLIKILEPGNIVTIHGIGGVGKTALALQSLWNICTGCDKNLPPKKFSKGIIYFSFLEKRNPEYVFDHIVRSFDERAHDTSKDAAFRYLSRCKELLLVLDNAEEANNIQSVLDICNDCCVLIISRKKSDVFGLEIELKSFGIDDSLKLFNRILGNSDDRVTKTICDYVGGLPLAIQLIAKYLYITKQNPVEYQKSLIDKPFHALATSYISNKSIPRLLEKSLEQVSTHGSDKVLSIIGMLSYSPFRIELISKICTNIDRAIGFNKILNQLYNFGILNKIGEKYSLSHILIYRYINEYFKISTKLIKLTLKYYIEYLAISLKSYNFIELENERNHLIRIFNLSVDKKELWEESLDLAYHLNDFLLNCGYAFDLKNILKISVNISKKLGNIRYEGLFCNLLGNIYFDSGDINEAKIKYDHALKYFQINGSDEDLCQSYENMGNLFHHLGNNKESIYYYNKALELSQKINNKSIESSLLVDLGNVYIDLDQKNALKYYVKALKISKKYNFLNTLSVSIGSIGNIFYHKGFHEIAIKNYNEALELSKKIHFKHSEMTQYGNLGDIYRERNELREAEKFLEKALSISREIDNQINECFWTNKIGKLKISQGNIDESLKFFFKALDICRRAKISFLEESILCSLGSAYQKLGNKEISEKYYKKANDIKWDS